MKTTTYLAVFAVSLAALSGCSHPLLLGRIGDDMDRASPYALCRAHSSIAGSQAAIDAVERRGIDCSKYEAAISAQRQAGVATGAAIMQNTKSTYRPPTQQTTTCYQAGATVQCSTN